MKRSLAIVALAIVAAAPAGCATATVAAEHHLVFVRATEPRNATVWIAEANGRGTHRLTRGYAAAVAPNGRTIAIGRREGIHLISSDGKHERRSTPKNRWPEAWSPDVKWIVAKTDNSLAVLDVDSGRTRVVAHGVFYGFGLSPDGRRLIYARAPRTGGEDICTVRPDLYTVAWLAAGYCG
jgi:hypothetical protein